MSSSNCRLISMASPVLLLCVLLSTCARSLSEPNVVVLLANNVRADDLSCFNPATPVPTPNIDRSVRGGQMGLIAEHPRGVQKARRTETLSWMSHHCNQHLILAMGVTPISS